MMHPLPQAFVDFAVSLCGWGLVIALVPIFLALFISRIDGIIARAFNPRPGGHPVLQIPEDGPLP